MQYFHHVPAAAPLSAAVECIFSLDNYQPEHSAERLVPDGRANLVIELDGRERFVYDNHSGQITQRCREAWLSGVHSQFITIGDTSTSSRLAAVRFAPGRALPVIGTDMGNFNDRVVPAISVFGESIVDLRSALLRCDTPEAIVLKIEEWLTDRYEVDLEPPTIVSEVIDLMTSDPGGIALTELVSSRGSISYKHFVELFRQHVGPTPKRMHRILRFAQVFERIQNRERLDWAALSFSLGYSDQAHFIRDFQSFSGYRPSEFLQADHERLNFFPVDHPAGE